MLHFNLPASFKSHKAQAMSVERMLQGKAQAHLLTQPGHAQFPQPLGCIQVPQLLGCTWLPQ
jgi:hypothetical protein